MSLHLDICSDRATNINRDVNADSIVLNPRPLVIVIFLGSIVANNQSVLGEFLEEALWLGALDVEVQRLGDGAHGEQRKKCPHCRFWGVIVIEDSINSSLVGYS